MPIRSRVQMWKALINKREQMVGEAGRMADDQDHWNRINPDQEPINIPLDIGPDVEWSRNAPGEDEGELVALLPARCRREARYF